MFDKREFTSNISEIVARISEKTHEATVITDADGDKITIIAKSKHTLRCIASALSESDYIVTYTGDSSNFIRVSPNDCDTMASKPAISHIPLTFAEAIQLVKNAGFGVVEEVRNGVSHATAVANSISHDSLTKTVYALCHGGISVIYYGVGNFFEFDGTQVSSTEETPAISCETVVEAAV